MCVKRLECATGHVLCFVLYVLWHFKVIMAKLGNTLACWKCHDAHPTSTGCPSVYTLTLLCHKLCDDIVSQVLFVCGSSTRSGKASQCLFAQEEGQRIVPKFKGGGANKIQGGQPPSGKPIPKRGGDKSGGRVKAPPALPVVFITMESALATDFTCFKHLSMIWMVDRARYLRFLLCLIHSTCILDISTKNCNCFWNHQIQVHHIKGILGFPHIYL